MAIYALTVFLSAALLFQVQLIIAKYILPWFGGTPTVWTTCMLFFQALLTGGYAYSHGIVSRLSARLQGRAHLVLLLASISLLGLQTFAWGAPLLPGPAWRHSGSDIPIARIVGLLAVSVGLPFLILSATSSLLQAWFTWTFPNRSPYRLYALSNAGSLLGLLSYPFFVEPNFALSLQSKMWSGLYVGFALCCGFIALRAARHAESRPRPEVLSDPPPESGEPEEPGWLQRLLWLTLAAGASTVLLATTNQVNEEIAVVPFFWVVPLAIYLLTFTLCFSSEWFYWRPLFVVTAAAIMWFVGRTILRMPVTAVGGAFDVGIIEQMAAYYFALFICCMLCHGELVRLKPGVRHLTQFYLMVSIGGALGGIFVGIIAPCFFQVLWELYVGYFLCGCGVIAAALREDKSLLNIPRWGWALRVPAVGLLTLLGIGPFFLLADRLPQNYRNAMSAIKARLTFDEYVPEGDIGERNVALRRNFYGILRVTEVYPHDPRGHMYVMYHGQTTHGFQFQDETKHSLPTTYYTEHSGVGLAIMNHQRYRSHGESASQMRVGIVGLGAGTLAAYAREGDYYRIYEINPAVVELAASEDGYFSFVPDSEAKVDVILGDARSSMEHEEPQRFDILALDPFCGGTPPVHLLTREAFGVYLRHVRHGGVIAIHISNRYLDLRPIVWKLADEFGLSAVHISSDAREGRSYEADWVLLTRKNEFVHHASIVRASSPRNGDEDLKAIHTWTDDYSNLYQLLR
jgi:hypothetical protein